jgi:hypothetical protein
VADGYVQRARGLGKHLVEEHLVSCRVARDVGAGVGAAGAGEREHGGCCGAARSPIHFNFLNPSPRLWLRRAF